MRPVEWVPNRRMMRFYIFPWKRNRGENVAMVARSFPTCYPRIPRLFRLLYGDYWGWQTATHPPTLTYSTSLSLIRYYTVYLLLLRALFKKSLATLLVCCRMIDQKWQKGPDFYSTIEFWYMIPPKKSKVFEQNFSKLRSIIVHI